MNGWTAGIKHDGGARNRGEPEFEGCVIKEWGFERGVGGWDEDVCLAWSAAAPSPQIEPISKRPKRFDHIEVSSNGIGDLSYKKRKSIGSIATNVLLIMLLIR